MKKFLLAVLMFTAIFSSAKAQAGYDFYDTCVTGQLLYFQILSNSSVAVVHGGECDHERLTGEMEIPHDVEHDGVTYSVTQIGNQAFNDAPELTSVIIPNSVTSIGNSVFSRDSSLTSVTIPNSVISIGVSTFFNCISLTSITIPNSVTSIGMNAFYGCASLTSITIPSSVTFIDNGAFSNCPSLTSIVVATDNPIYNSLDNNRRGNCNAVIRTADNTLIVGCRATVIPNSVTSVGDFAFYYCTGLTSVTIPSSVVSIGSSAFLGCTGLISIVVETGNSVYDSRENCNAIILTADNTLIKGSQSTVIPNSVTSIDNYAFDGFTGLTSVTIPSSIVSIGSYAFRKCTGLSSVAIPNSVTSIGNSAFYGCTGLHALTIPNSVTSIGNDAFIGCSGLASIVVETGNPVYDSRDNCNAIIRTADNALITGCQSTVIPNTVTSVGGFSGCTGLTSVTIPNSVTFIADYAFRGCTGLISVSIPNSITSIGIGVFDGCTGLISVTIPNSVTTIGLQDFNGSFNGCTSLTSITIPSSVTSIGSRVFNGCTGLTSIVVESGNPVYDSRDNCNAIIRTADNTLIAECKTTVIPNTVTSIGEYAFSGCTDLTSVTIPSSVTSIGIYAFSDCSNLTSVTFEGVTPPSLEGCFYSTFPASNGLTIYVPSGSAENYEGFFGPTSNVNIVDGHVAIDVHDGFCFKIYPNPTNGVAYVLCSKNNVQMEAAEILLFDAYGKLLNVIVINNDGPTQIDLSRFAPGVYFVKTVAGGDVMKTMKVVRN